METSKLSQTDSGNNMWDTFCWCIHVELINFCARKKSERNVRITGIQYKRESVYPSPAPPWTSAASKRYTVLQRPDVSRDFMPPLNLSWGLLGYQSRGVLLLLCLDFLHSNCFHVAGNAILDLPLVISSLSHQGFSATSPTLHPLILWGLKNSTQLGGAISEFSHTRWRQWAWSSWMWALYMERREAFLKVCFHIYSMSFTHTFMLCTCEDFGEVGAVKSGFFNCCFESFLLRMFLQISALMQSPGKAGVWEGLFSRFRLVMAKLNIVNI